MQMILMVRTVVVAGCTAAAGGGWFAAVRALPSLERFHQESKEKCTS